MSIANEPTAPPRSRYVPPIDPEDLRRRNAEMIAILDGWEADGDDDDQRDTMAVLRQSLGSARTISDRSAFRP